MNIQTTAKAQPGASEYIPRRSLDEAGKTGAVLLRPLALDLCSAADGEGTAMVGGDSQGQRWP